MCSSIEVNRARVVRRGYFPVGDVMSIEFAAIGHVRSPFTDPAGMPIQPSRARDVAGTVELLPEYAEGLVDLDGFSHIILLYHFHRSSGFALKVTPFLDDVPRGLFSTRAPRRPNPIGLSIVELRSIEDTVLSIVGVDMLDGTPVLDIKPYVGEFDARTPSRGGWFDEARYRRRRVEADDRFRSPE